LLTVIGSGLGGKSKMIRGITLFVVHLSIFISGIALGADAAVLQGGVEQLEVLPRPNLERMQGRIDPRGFGSKQKCACIDPSRVSVVMHNDRYKIFDGENWLLDFGPRGEAADTAVQTIKHYGFTELCTVGDTSADGTAQMQYFTVNDKSPTGTLSGEDAVGFHPLHIKAEQIQGTWKITEGDHWMLDFGRDQESAQAAAKVIQYYGFSSMCFVGRPNAPMMYFKK
jgi:hypothetical protein